MQKHKNYHNDVIYMLIHALYFIHCPPRMVAWFLHVQCQERLIHSRYDPWRSEIWDFIRKTKGCLMNFEPLDCKLNPGVAFSSFSLKNHWGITAEEIGGQCGERCGPVPRSHFWGQDSGSWDGEWIVLSFHILLIHCFSCTMNHLLPY